ncbi:hypothetical protein BpHYR1_052572 [Brachionus plicatilis]|uniref:Uncharacterized protein n=1 Tax=Brachionus plicatilis TaxID=10195 RepID=A0A3M7QVA0_BRAPC|nr:hypothetical protein BpHYR1_052572 [Brachionus plicatilis]
MDQIRNRKFVGCIHKLRYLIIHVIYGYIEKKCVAENLAVYRLSLANKLNLNEVTENLEIVVGSQLKLV